MTTRQLLIATHNAGKVAEFADMMHDLHVNWLSLDDVGITLDVAETGHTLLENATLKAKGYAQASGLLTLADDTGLEIDSLDGAPGIYPARYGGGNLSAKERYELILNQMTNVPMIERTACFRCVIAVANPTSLLAHVEGIFAGKIALAPAGDGGFGYDPIFYVPSLNKTVAQLPAEVKHQISHRGQAIQKLSPILHKLLSTT